MVIMHICVENVFHEETGVVPTSLPSMSNKIHDSKHGIPVREIKVLKSDKPASYLRSGRSRRPELSASKLSSSVAQISAFG